MFCKSLPEKIISLRYDISLSIIFNWYLLKIGVKCYSSKAKKSVANDSPLRYLSYLSFHSGKIPLDLF